MIEIASQDPGECEKKHVHHTTDSNSTKINSHSEATRFEEPIVAVRIHVYYGPFPYAYAHVCK